MSAVNKAKSKTKPKANEIDAHIGKTIRNIRVLSGYSQEQIAEKIDVTFQQVQKYEYGTNRISASRMYALSKVLNVEIKEFFSGLDKKGKGNKMSVINSLDMKTIKLLSMFNEIKNPEIKELIITLLKEAAGE